MLLPAEKKPQGERHKVRFKKQYNILNSGCGLVRIVKEAYMVKEASAEEPRKNRGQIIPRFRPLLKTPSKAAGTFPPSPCNQP